MILLKMIILLRNNEHSFYNLHKVSNLKKWLYCTYKVLIVLRKLFKSPTSFRFNSTLNAWRVNDFPVILSRGRWKSHRKRKHGVPGRFVKHISTKRGSERFEDIQRTVDSRVGQKGNLEECNFPRVHFEDPRVVWPMNLLVKLA